MKKILCCFLCLLTLDAFAAGTFTTLEHRETIYSEYYPNHAAKFKGNIIFINGSGTDISEWKRGKTFMECIKEKGSVFLYDRPGLGKSPPNFQLSAKNPLTAKLINDQLLALLKQLNIKPPYILIAHSYGAIYAGYFTLTNFKDVKGLFLIDPVPKNFYFSSKRIKKYEKGIKDTSLKPANYIYRKFSGSEVEIFYQLLGFEESKQSIKKLGTINKAIPVIIISSTGMEKEHPLQEDWYISQKQWLNKNPISKIIQVSSDHFIQLEKPTKLCDEFNLIILNSDP